MVKVLVAGAGGALGTALCGLLRGGFEVVALDHAKLDVSRRNDVVAAVAAAKPHVVVDAAAYTDVDGCEHDKWRAYLTNRDGAEHLSRAAAQVGALMVYPSCDLVFDGMRIEPYREEDPPNPLQVYGDTKLAGELVTLTHAPRHLVLRSGWLYGAAGRSYLGDILSWRHTEEVIFGYEDQKAQPTPVSEFAAVVVELIRRGETGIWHAATEGDASQFDVAQETFRILGLKNIRVKPLRRGAGGQAALRPKYSVLNTSKLRGAGLRLPHWKDALKAYLKTVASIQ